MATKIIFGNLEKGSGKTTLAVMMSTLLQKQARKTLLIDLDPEASATSMVSRMFIDQVQVGSLEVYEAMQQRDLRKGLRTLTPHLDFIPSSSTLHNFPMLLAEQSSSFIIRDLVEELENEYEYIILDVSSIVNELTDNALASSDYVVPILDSCMPALQTMNHYFNYIDYIKANLNESIQILGVVSSLIFPSVPTESWKFEDLSADVDELLFEAIIVDRSEEGLALHHMYKAVLEEIMESLEQRSQDEQNVRCQMQSRNTSICFLYEGYSFQSR